MLLPDYHIHTARCGHATGTMSEYVESAIELGMQEIGFSDHIPMYWLDKKYRDPGIAMAMEKLPAYVCQVHKLQKMYPHISIRLGIEADYVPGYEDELKSVLDAYPFDYVLGSIHYIEGWGFDNSAYLYRYNQLNIDNLYEKYFKLLQQAACSGLFDVMAHPDLIKKFGYRPSGSLQKLYDETAEVFAEMDVCIEINTAGLRVPVEEVYPSLSFLRVCQNCGVAVTTGSDAHAPGQIGYQFNIIPGLLSEAGYTKVAFFKQRKINRLL